MLVGVLLRPRSSRLLWTAARESRNVSKWRRTAYWLAPLGLGLGLAYGSQPVSVSSLLASPEIIPCRPTPKPFILSPTENERSIALRLSDFFIDHIWEDIRIAARFLHLFFLFVPVLLSSPMLLVGTPDKKLGGDKWGAVWWYGVLVNRMEAAGPTFIKLAQWAGSRSDLFPPILCEKFGALHSRGKPHSFSHTRRVIERVFQRPFEDVFEDFNQTPIGTGAIAQVYRAVLNPHLLPPSYLDSKRKRVTTLSPALLQDRPAPSVPSAAVAIKVLHPRVTKMISRDLQIMSFFAKAINVLPGMQWFSLPEEVQVFGEMMFQQLDLRHEADNLLAFEANFAHRNVPVRFPTPLKEFSSRDVLIEEYENAVPMELFLKNGGGAYDDELATAGLNAFLNMLLLDNFIHSDLHPGNILIKFSRPLSSTAVLRNIVSSMFNNGSKTPPEDNSQVDAETAEESNTIASTLREQKDDLAKWSSTLDHLREKGYIPEIVFIDAGLTTTLSASNRENFIDLFRAIAEFDGYRAGELMVARCKAPELAIDPHTFALKMQHLVLKVKRKTFTLAQIRISDILSDVLRSVRAHHVKMEADFVNTVLSILLLEGIGRRLDPNLDLFRSARPLLRQLGGQLAAGEMAEGSSNAADRIKNLPRSNLGTLLKVWVWMEARDFIASASVNIDSLIKYDWLAPNV